MDRLAFIIGNIFLYWDSVILALACTSAVLLFAAFYLDFGGNALALEAVVPLAVTFSLLAARFFHWYSCWDRYAGFLTAMTELSSGGFALMGVFLGCFLAAVTVHLTGLEQKLMQLLDAMSLAGAAGIAVGRLSFLYNAGDRGQVLQSVSGLPWAYPVVNQVTGQMEMRLATFVLQAMAVGVIFLVLAAYSRWKGRKSGEITLLFLLLYGASQAILDSTRYDSLYFRSNGFISIVQVAGAVAAVAVTVFFAVRLVKVWGLKKWFPALWLLSAALMGGAGYMEYHVQRHGDRAVFAYCWMSVFLVLFVSASVGMFTALKYKENGPSQ